MSSSSADAPKPAPKKSFTAADLRDCATALTDKMNDGAYEALYYSVIEKMEGPPQPNVLLFAMEKLQCETLVDMGYPDGPKALEDLKGAVRRYPQDKVLRERVIALCDVEEKMMNRVQQKRCAVLGIKIMTQSEQEEIMQKQQKAMMQMQEAMESLPEERQKKMMEISNKIKSGQRPSPEEVAYVQECRQMMNAYIVTMQEMMAEVAGGDDETK